MEMDIRIIRYPVSVSTKTCNMDTLFIFVSNMDTKGIYPNSFYSVFLHQVPNLYSKIFDDILSAKKIR
jgi:hypothetical protein